MSDRTDILAVMVMPGSAELAALTERQCGIVTAGQAVEAGLTVDAITTKLRYGRWQRMHRGAYATCSGEPTRLSLLWAAVLSAGSGAMLSHLTAAELAGLTDRPGELVHVTVPSTRRVSGTPGFVVHCSARASQALHPARLPPQTRIEETVLELAGAARAIEDACGWLTRSLQRGLTTRASLGHHLELRPKIRWRSELAELLTLDADGLHSVLERRYQRDVERPHGLPRGIRQARFRRGNHDEYRDLLYEAYLTAVVLDGELAHPSETRWRDIRRDNSAVADGIVTLRYGWLDVTTSPCQVAAEVARVLARRGFTGARPFSSRCPAGAGRQAPATPAPAPSRPPSPSPAPPRPAPVPPRRVRAGTVRARPGAASPAGRSSAGQPGRIPAGARGPGHG